MNKRISELKRELKNIDKRKLREIRGRSGQFTVSLVGYTNAGKSTLLNKLTGSDVFVEDRLFATLDTRTRKWSLKNGLDVLLSDTVGFIANLPHQLVASFKATLEEAVNADLLLHVIDASNPQAQKQIESVNKVLNEIGCGEKQVMMLLNKIDIISDISVYETLETMYPDAISISAKIDIGLDKLSESIAARYKGDELLLLVNSLQSNGKIQSFLRAHGQIEEEQYEDGRILTTVRLGQRQLPPLKSLRPESIEIIEK